jgi:NhaP-type Na+/H+ and K+/H+ antiporter
MSSRQVVFNVVFFIFLLSLLNVLGMLMQPSSAWSELNAERLHDFMAAAGFCTLNLWNILYLTHHKLVI